MNIFKGGVRNAYFYKILLFLKVILLMGNLIILETDVWKIKNECQ